VADQRGLVDDERATHDPKQSKRFIEAARTASADEMKRPPISLSNE
jgi:hypothetical protein